MNLQRMAAAEKVAVELGYLKLTDAAPLVIANELGFFSDAGLKVTLTQEVSWANIRDKLATGALDGAQMLAPLPAMTTLGVSGLRIPLITGLVLSRNGNAITLSKRLLDDVDTQQFCETDRLISASLINHLKVQTGRRLTLAVVHGFSTHNLMLRRWLKQGDVDPDKDVSIIIVPPSQVVDSLESGVIDGFCAGSPWGTIAAARGTGFTLAAGIDIWRDAPEKVFCVSEAWHESHPSTHLRLRIALMRACDWLADMGNRQECAEILSLPCYLDLPVKDLLPSLSGRIPLGPAQNILDVPDFHLFRSQPPSRQQFTVMINECNQLIGDVLTQEQVDDVSLRTAREDLFEEASDILHADTALV